MQGNDGEEEKPKSTGFYTYHGVRKPSGETSTPQSTATQAEADETAAPTVLPESSEFSGNQTDNDDDKNPKTSRKKLVSGLLFAVLFAAALFVVAVFGGKFGLTGVSMMNTVEPKASSLNQAFSPADSYPALFLIAQPWEKKTHSSDKSLLKMKNLRYALTFFKNYTPQQIAEIPATAVSISSALDNYDNVVGTMLTIQADITKKYPVTESIDLTSSAPSTLLALSTGQPGKSASLLVIGSELADLNTGDKLTIQCLAIYRYSPKDSSGDDMIFFITIPELIHKT
jgi:hypothetical protein